MDSPILDENTTLRPCRLFCLYTAIMTSISPAEARFSFITSSALLIRKNFLPCLPSCCQFASPPSGRKQAWRQYLNLSEFRKTHLPNTNCQREVNEGLFISRALCSCCAFTSPFHAGRERCSSAAMLGGHSLAPLWKITLIHPPCFTGKKWSSGLKCDTKWKKINPNSISAAAHQGLLSRDHLDPGGFPRKDRDPNYLKSILPAPPSLCCLQVHAWHHSYRQPPRPWQQGGQPDRLGLCRRERMRRERGGEGES